MTSRIKNADLSAFNAAISNAGPDASFEVNVQGGRQSLSWQSADRGITYRAAETQIIAENELGQPSQVNQYEFSADVLLSRSLISTYAAYLPTNGTDVTSNEKLQFDAAFNLTNNLTIFSQSLNSRGSIISWQSDDQVHSYSVQIQKQRFSDVTIPPQTQYHFSAAENRRLSDIRVFAAS